MQLKVIGTGSKGNAYLLENEQEALLIECGVNIKAIKQALRFNLSKLVGALVTHEHGDHAKSIKDVMAAGIDVYATGGTHAACGTIPKHRAKIINDIDEFKLGGFKIRAFQIEHDASEPCGFLINHTETGNVLFLTDTMYSPYTFRNLHNIIIEANYSHEVIRVKLSEMEFLKNRVMQSHMSLDTCIGFLKNNDLSKVNNIVLIHLSDGNSDEKLFKSEVEKATGKTVTVADNGLEMEFNKTPFLDMGDFKNYREESRKKWGDNTPGILHLEQINTGCLLRIADSLERMEKPYKKLLDDTEYLQTRHRENLDRIEYLEKSRAAYKGVITKLKNKES